MVTSQSLPYSLPTRRKEINPTQHSLGTNYQSVLKSISHPVYIHIIMGDAFSAFLSTPAGVHWKNWVLGG